jgi:hypothetical protein
MDMASANMFLSNYEALSLEDARAVVEHVVEFDRYSEPMKKRLRQYV